MESYPPQLMVDAPDGRYYVGLTETTEVSKEGRAADWGELRPSVEVLVEGEPTGADDTGMMATRIQIS